MAIEKSCHKSNPDSNKYTSLSPVSLSFPFSIFETYPYNLLDWQGIWVFWLHDQRELNKKREKKTSVSRWEERVFISTSWGAPLNVC